MALWNFIKDKAAISRLRDEAIHAAAMEEINSGRRRDGLWTKAIIESNGNESTAKIVYLRLLVAAIRDDIYLAQRAEEIFSTNRPSPASAPNRPRSEPEPAPDAEPVPERQPESKAAPEPELEANAEAVPKPAPPVMASNPPRDPESARLVNLCVRLRSDDLALDQYRVLAKKVGASLKTERFWGGTYIVTFEGERYVFNNLPALRPWFLSHVVPRIESIA